MFLSTGTNALPSSAQSFQVEEPFSFWIVYPFTLILGAAESSFLYATSKVLSLDVLVIVQLSSRTFRSESFIRRGSETAAPPLTMLLSVKLTVVTFSVRLNASVYVASFVLSEAIVIMDEFLL